MDITIVIAAISFGLISGFHCVGMCAPIALSLGISNKNRFKFYWQNFLYQSGRIVTYTILGALVGIVGQGFDIAGYQRYLSIIAGILLILMVLMPGKAVEMNTQFSQLKFMNRWISKVKNALGKFIRKPSNFSRFLTGIINGFLPCGVVYMALTSALAAGGIWQSSLFMTLFGLGTFPMMFLVVVIGNFIGANLKGKILKLIPIFIILIGILFILRGLNLGIPFISPTSHALHIKPTQGCCK